MTCIPASRLWVCSQDAVTMINTNVIAVALLTRHFAPGMVERNRGHIINVSSIAAHYAYSGGRQLCTQSLITPSPPRFSIASSFELALLTHQPAHVFGCSGCGCAVLKLRRPLRTCLHPRALAATRDCSAVPGP